VVVTGRASDGGVAERAAALIRVVDARTGGAPATVTPVETAIGAAAVVAVGAATAGGVLDAATCAGAGTAGADGDGGGGGAGADCPTGAVAGALSTGAGATTGAGGAPARAGRYASGST
jgi:hypothetical protein